jgi:hypothetical protein
MAEHHYLAELRKFLQFLSSLWGILAGISMLFPLSNLLVGVIPAAGHGKPFDAISPAVVTSITTVSCLFITFATFARRDQYGNPGRRPKLGRSAGISFLVGVAALAFYVLTPPGLYVILVEENPDSALYVALYDGLFSILYAMFFVLLTRSFLVLAMLEYFAPQTGKIIQPPQGQ